MLTGPTAFPVLGGLLVDAVQTRLRTAGTWQTSMRAAVVPWPIVPDDCQCGLLAVSFGRITGSQDGTLEGGAAGGEAAFTPPTSAIPWPPFLLGEFQVAVMRCSTAEGVPPAETLEAEAAVVHADSYWATVGVYCELQRLFKADEIIDYAARDMLFIPTGGACQGATVNGVVSVPLACPC